MKKILNLSVAQAFFVLVAISSLSLTDTLAQQKEPKPSLTTVAALPSLTPKASAPNLPPAAAPIKVSGLTISGSIRARFESWDWFDVNPATADDSYNFGAVQLRLAIGQSKEKWEWQVEGEAPVFIGLPERASAPEPQGQLGFGGSYFAANGRQDASGILKQAFVRFKGVFGDKASSVKVGRFEFNDGTEIIPVDASLATIKRDHISQRLIGAFAFTHVGRSFDGLQYSRNAKVGNFTFLGVRPTAGAFDLDANKELDVDLWYGAFTKPRKFQAGESEVRLFALHYHDGRRVLKTDSRTAALRNADVSNIRVTTFGGHYIGVYKAGSGKVDVLLWGAGQTGSWGNLEQRSAALAVEGGYQFGGKAVSKIKPWLRAGYFRSTGDGDATDGQHNTFFQVLPTPRIYARFPFYNQMNNEDSFVELRLKPHAKLGLRTDYHYLRLSNAKDLWYVGGGAFQKQTFGYVGRPSNGQKALGHFVDFSADYAVTSRSSFTFYLGGVKGGKMPAAIYPLGSNSRYAYLEFTQKF